MLEGTMKVVESIELPTAMTPGQPYAISFERDTKLIKPAHWIEEITA